MIKEKSKTWSNISSWAGRNVGKNLPFPPLLYTLSSFFIAAIGLFFSYQLYYKIAILCFLLSGILDVLDGAVARAQNKVTSFGAFLDGTTDRFVDFAMIYAYFFFDIKPVGLSLDQLICITSFVVILPSFIVAYANHRGAVDDDKETLIWRVMNRLEMWVIMMSIYIVSLFNPVWAGYLLVLLIMLATITIIQTIAVTMYHARKRMIHADK